MEIEFRESFLKDVYRIREKESRKKIANVITELKAAFSLSAIRNVKKMEGSDNYYLNRIGDYRIGFRLKDGSLIFSFGVRTAMTFTVTSRNCVAPTPTYKETP